MGISGFIQTVKSVHEPMHIKEYAGKVVAVDGNVWLHKGAFSCSMELALEEATTKYIDYFMRLVSLLEFYKVVPYIVFDGQALPIKGATVEERRRRRTEALAKGKELLKQGKQREATECFQHSIHVTPHMIQQVVKALNAKKIKHIVAPYEADAQLTHLINTNKVDAVITEDSDLLVFGCHTVLFKMNQYGEGIRIQQGNLSAAKEIDLQGWDQTRIRHMCILSGCDYLASLPGIGLKSAHKLLKKYRTTDAVLRHLRFQGKMKQVPDYEHLFKRANNAFLYQYVYDDNVKRRITLHTPPADVQPDKLDYLGNNTTASSGANPQQIHDHSLSNKENIPPWAHFDNKQSSTASQHKPEASQPTSSGGLRASNDNALRPLRTPKRLSPLSPSKPPTPLPQQQQRTITAKELFKVFNHRQKQSSSATKIQTHGDLASAFQRQRDRNALSSFNNNNNNTHNIKYNDENAKTISMPLKTIGTKRKNDCQIPDARTNKRRTPLKFVYTPQ
ncbi:PIN domain-like protein [Zychaea mexicana]|uniref:PIN domain-like protein n=1 Tax=Zychaea mexicana TaxID=64656 RepID=UPI0022FE9ECF|nr:PIN domain-like protein [Zychaea mexicana]KAI9488331.1 PIN domain-like protein [Zychaea mexicana]